MWVTVLSLLVQPLLKERDNVSDSAISFSSAITEWDNVTDSAVSFSSAITEWER